MWTRKIQVLLGLCCLAVALASASASLDTPVLDMSGFSWVENLYFDGEGNLFVSDLTTGILWRIFYNETAGDYEREAFVSFDGHVLGLAVWNPQTQGEIVAGLPPKPVLFAAGSNNSVNVVTAFEAGNMTSGNPTAVTIATLNSVGNGMALWEKEENELVLFVTQESDFIPKDGNVLQINVTTGEVATIISGLEAADGAQVWCPSPIPGQGGCILVVSEVLSGVMLVYDLDSSEIIHKYSAPHPTLRIDDFCISPDGSTIYGADFVGGQIVSFATDGSSSESQVVASGISTPTSVRIGNGFGFHNTSLYVSQGGGLFRSDTNRRVIEIPNVL